MDPLVPLYTRELPGGGFVRIETSSPTPEAYEGRLSVERRTDPDRRTGHSPPVIAEVRAPSVQEVLRALVQIASDNVAVARGLIQWQTRRRAD